MKGVILIFMCALYGGHSFCTINNELVEKEIIVIIPSYNNAKWYSKNLDSIFTQQYSNYKVIYINDNSNDATYSLVTAYIQERHLENKIEIINNTERHGALYNVYHAVHLCPDHAIILIVDGDDW